LLKPEDKDYSANYPACKKGMNKNIYKLDFSTISDCIESFRKHTSYTVSSFYKMPSKGRC